MTVVHSLNITRVYLELKISYVFLGGGCKSNHWAKQLVNGEKPVVSILERKSRAKN